MSWNLKQLEHDEPGVMYGSAYVFKLRCPWEPKKSFIVWRYWVVNSLQSQDSLKTASRQSQDSVKTVSRQYQDRQDIIKTVKAWSEQLHFCSFLLHTFLFKVAKTEKSIGFRSWEEGVHMFWSQKSYWLSNTFTRCICSWVKTNRWQCKKFKWHMILPIIRLSVPFHWSTLYFNDAIALSSWLTLYLLLVQIGKSSFATTCTSFYRELATSEARRGRRKFPYFYFKTNFTQNNYLCYFSQQCRRDLVSQKWFSKQVFSWNDNGYIKSADRRRHCQSK